jgi:hypothetical protein
MQELRADYRLTLRTDASLSTHMFFSNVIKCLNLPETSVTELKRILCAYKPGSMKILDQTIPNLSSELSNIFTLDLATERLSSLELLARDLNLTDDTKLIAAISNFDLRSMTNYSDGITLKGLKQLFGGKYSVNYVGRKNDDIIMILF